ncbi:MAG: hypothetical protein M1431_03055 [Candidatus Thermoplasmatota archaeon]|nr:hypothetical protein [Candidatus Thermoplasmatota archaeon]
MQEPDSSDEGCFWLPIPKKLAFRYWFQFPGRSDEDFIRELPEITLVTLKAINKMQLRGAPVSPQVKQEN